MLAHRDPTLQRLLPYEAARPARLGQLLDSRIAEFFPTVTLPVESVCVAVDRGDALDGLLVALRHALDVVGSDRAAVLLAGTVAFADLQAAASASWSGLEDGWRPTSGARTAATAALEGLTLREPCAQDLVRRVVSQAWVRERVASEEAFLALEDDVLLAVSGALEPPTSPVPAVAARPPRSLPAPAGRRDDSGHVWLTVADVAARSQEHQETIRRRLRSGALPGQQHGGRGRWRVRADALDAVLDARAREQVTVKEDRSRVAEARAWLRDEKAKRRK